jgi:hypothetical protein
MSSKVITLLLAIFMPEEILFLLRMSTQEYTKIFISPASFCYIAAAAYIKTSLKAHRLR